MPATSRWQRWKERQDRQAFVVPVELDDALIRAMLDQGVISDRDSTDRQKIGQVIKRFVANAFGDLEV